MRISDWSSDVCSSDLQGFDRTRGARHRLHFIHQLLVDVEPARGVEHEDVIALELRRLHRALRDFDRLLPGDDRERRDVDLLTQDGKLFLRGGARSEERRVGKGGVSTCRFRWWS